ncbi:AAA family ATPase [Streptomyces sp. NPDC016172]|uniref:AAA family ATPase n=1 Tax=Streptomyces sp. NPDC016172 TaxID=3364964 RepID=UPI003701FDFD
MTGTPSGAHRRLSTATAAGREDTRLVVIRGNSASGKSSVAQGLRDHYGRGIAIVGQDVIRRNVLREHDTARGANIALLGRIARDALNAGFHVVLEGILYADRYSHLITSLVRDHRGVSRSYYLDVPLTWTCRWKRRLFGTRRRRMPRTWLTSPTATSPPGTASWICCPAVWRP